MDWRQWLRWMVAGFGCSGVLSPCVATEAFQPTPLGLPPVIAPRDNPPSRAKVELGKALFFDRRLSADGTIRCASCHDPKRVFTDGNPVSKGVHAARGTRNAPSLINVAYATTLFWDGRRDTLESQVKDPFVNPIEHGLHDQATLVRRIRNDARYRRQFTRVFGIQPQQISMDHVVKAIACFERTLIAGDSPFDRFEYGGDRQALSASARRPSSSSTARP